MHGARKCPRKCPWKCPLQCRLKCPWKPFSSGQAGAPGPAGQERVHRFPVWLWSNFLGRKSVKSDETQLGEGEPQPQTPRSWVNLSQHQVFSNELALCIRWPKYSASASLATLLCFNSHMWLVSIILHSSNIEHLFHCRKFCWTALLNWRSLEYNPDHILPYVDRNDLGWRIWSEDLNWVRF